MGAGIAFWIALLAIPMLVVFIDTFSQVRARFVTKNNFPVDDETERCEDYTLIVPIYGKIDYLENVEYLHQYGQNVLLTTSAAETPEFFAGLDQIAKDNGFRIHISPRPDHATDGKLVRQIGGTLRDTIVRDAHRVITTEYVVCIDADTETTLSIDYVVGAVHAANLDVASVRLVAANEKDNLLTRLQATEYDMAMRMRRVMPWLVSGGFHVLRREAHRDIMERHSLFFQGNDVELGLLAVRGKYKVGHVPFEVPTKVPNTIKGWWRQRKAWAGGEFRLMVLNPHVAFRHPWLYLYGLVVVFVMAPLRWYFLIHPSWTLLTTLGLYFVTVALLNWRRMHWSLLVYPIYSLIYTMILIPAGVFTYFRMAIKHRNFGIIRPNRANSENILPRPVHARDVVIDIRDSMPSEVVDTTASVKHSAPEYVPQASVS